MYKQKPKKTFRCIICGNDFQTYIHNKRVCFDECRNKTIYKQKTFGDANVCASQMGKYSELKISMDLIKRQYEVFYQLSPFSFCDIVAIKDNKIYRIECRTGRYGIDKTKISFPKTKHGEIDCFAVYAPEFDNVIYFDDSGYNKIDL